jgi:hypothetical protein
VAATDTILQAIQKLNGNVSGLVTGVSSVFGRTGAVSATSGDYNTSQVTENTNLYYTEARVSANTDVAANTAARHAAVTIGTANGLSLSTQALSLALASGSATGALSSTDWNTFNNKLSTATAASTYVPYTGATANVNLGTNSLTAGVGSFASSGGDPTFSINHSSGSGIALNITKGGNGEGLYINKTSGTGNAATIIGTLNATTLVKSGGTSSQFLKADGSVDSSTYLTTSAASSTYLPLAGGTLTGALSGTSATFSNKISANTSNSIFSNFGGAAIGTTAGNYTGISLGYSENTTYTKTAIVQEQINDGAARGHLHFLVDTANDGNNATLADSKFMINGLTGAATFSAQINAITAVFGNKGGGSFGVQISDNDQSNVRLRFTNTGSGGQSMSIVGGNPGLSNSGLSIYDETNAATRLHITSGGNLLVNRTSDLATGSSTSRLVVNGAVNVGSAVGNTSFGSKDDGGLGVYVGSGANAFQVWDDNQFSYPRFIVQRAGNVGIGTASPDARLSIVGASNTPTSYGTLLVKNSSEGGISFGASSTSYAWIQGNIYGGTYNFNLALNPQGGGVVVGGTSALGRLTSFSQATSVPAMWCSSNFSGDTGYTAMRIDKFDSNTTTSQIFINFSTGNNSNANGQINANGSGAVAFGSWSDKRLKENIVDLDPQLNNILSLRPVEFDYIESEGGGHQTGFIAQEMQEVYPDAVGERQDGMLTISGWSKTEARLVKAIQEQQAQIEELKAKILSL